MATPAMTSQTSALSEPSMSWSRQDFEQRLGFRGGRFTRVNNWLSLLLATSGTVVIYLLLIPFRETWIGRSLTERGPTPYAIVFFSVWSLAILFIKWQKLVLQRKSLQCEVVPMAHDFVLSSHTVDQVIENVMTTVDEAKHFILFNRLMIALSNLKNLGRVTDVDEILRSQGEQDESAMETSYSLVRGFIWAIPVLGFIGTVLGLSEAMGGFGQVLETTTEVTQIVDALKVVTAGLATAFETTLQALVAALGIQLLLTFLKKSEEEFLDGCSEYCLRRIVNRLRVMPYQQD